MPIENTSEQASGFMIINKHRGPSSHWVVNKMRSITSIRKIGHAGTLDPFATGVLLLAIGRNATKRIDKFVKMDKRYVAGLILGITSTTQDPEGVKTVNKKIEEIKEIKIIEDTIKKFVGEQEQIPPMFSAKKVDGKKLYLLARKGKEVERKPAHINIFSIKIISFEWPSLVLEIHCSSGTYIRTLAGDIGEALGVGAYLETLERTAVGNFLLEDSVKVDDLKKESWSQNLFDF